MEIDGWVTLAVIVVLSAAIITERVQATVALGGGVILLYLLGVVEAGDAFSGFSNFAPIIVAALYVMAGATEITGALSGLTSKALGNGANAGERNALARITFPATLASGFVPNTPLVAMFAPRVVAWGRRVGISPSRLLIPLSYAAILGGVITVLGTSTNLIVSGLLSDAGERPLDIFEITPVGLPLALAGVVLLIVVAPWLLPKRRAADADLEYVREFTVEMVVESGSRLAGTTVADAQLRNLQGVYLVEILRGDTVIAPVAPDRRLEEDDRLVFAGAVDKVVDLQGIDGLVMAEEHHVRASGGMGHKFYEVVVAEGSALDGATLKDVRFRSAYGAAVMAVHRASERLGGKLGDLPLRTGDVLLVVAPEEFRELMADRGAFSVIAPFDGAPPRRRRGARLVEVSMLALVVLAATGVLDLTRAALGVALFLVLARVVTPTEAVRSINLNVIVMIAFSIGLGRAVAESGLAAAVADGLLSVTSNWGDLGIVLGIALGTLLATELLTNNAAAALMFPVAMATAESAGMDVRPLAIVILLLASCSFLTPIGYQTNTMVFGMGGYRFTDFTRVGLPLTLTTLAVTVLLVPVMFPLR
ncbi:MAG: SLC13 family permease [Acidimicrobiia bacterium]|nr:SLC13 family permease [Acidimicrobiia bacterium]